MTAMPLGENDPADAMLMELLAKLPPLAVKDAAELTVSVDLTRLEPAAAKEAVAVNEAEKEGTKKGTNSNISHEAVIFAVAAFLVTVTT
ncbi:hypothetical protein [Fimbriiglobus ruber]|uniref:hypothetical protein n=1 Tax=Fimbriiglobus ruber TaxID=1908690 RepID=UPI00117A8417|nr:hypothetical protein [Fimbriiglobus ruber]